ncbi:Glycine betaine ABC transporter, substrate-binding protein OtaC [Olavius algarvensis associated proteobacterium Delta 3]|nr:Glycine betaine ABC transporter, substrate-binding protein OtaC [Olavius algarvensis associated proteobacterium Delta 3]CAB5171475.1 Glycine betaine ABC transporter, substrate-binding protein OtaC [Olavius algarvensis associated proteobacterium Delta 3]
MRNKATIYIAAVLFGFVFILTVILPVQTRAADKVVRLGYVEWSETIASTNLVQAVLQENLGVQCEIIPMTADKMWDAVATGEVDAIVAAWLPSTHGHYYKKVKDRVVDLGPNLEGTRIGLVVPDITVGRQTAATGQRNAPYITVESIPELKDYARNFRGKIIGIDPEAGIMKKTREAMQVYGLSNYRLIQGSEISMAAELSDAIRKQKWIVVTGWIPHWKFARWKLKFLEDPKNVFGGKERIHTMVRKGLKRDMPEVYQFLDNFQWSPDELGQLMIWIQEDEGLFPYDKALRYMRYYPEQIQSWLK